MQTRKSKQGASRASKSAVNRKRNKRKRTVPSRRTAGAPAIGVQVGHLSTCAETYLRVLANPFADISNACIPDAVTLPSTKVVTTCRGVWHSGTLGFGAIGVNPWSMVHSNASTSGLGSSAPVAFTLTTFAGVAIPSGITSAIANINEAASNSPLSSGALVLGSGREFRLVGCGLRVRYIGTELSRSGRLVLWRPRNNTPIAGASFSCITSLSDNYYHTSAIDRAWREITYLPTRSADVTYGHYVDPSLTSVVDDYRVLWAFVDGTTAASSFEFEVKAYFEIVGSPMSGAGYLQPTKSHADPTGFGAIMTSIPNKIYTGAGDLYTAMKSGAIKALEYSTSGLVTMGARALGNAMFGPMGGAAAGAIAGAAMPTITDVDD